MLRNLSFSPSNSLLFVFFAQANIYEVLTVLVFTLSENRVNFNELMLFKKYIKNLFFIHSLYIPNLLRAAFCHQLLHFQVPVIVALVYCTTSLLRIIARAIHSITGACIFVKLAGFGSPSKKKSPETMRHFVVTK